MQDWLADATEVERETMIQTLYGMWLARNEARDGHRIADARTVARRVCDHMNEWREVHPKGPRVLSEKIMETWKPPEMGWVKANADGASTKLRTRGGGGVVLRDHGGAFRGGARAFLPSTSDPQLLELMASRQAMQLAIQQGFQKVHLELDSKEVVAMLNGSSKNLPAVGPLIDEVKEMLRTRQECKVS